MKKTFYTEFKSNFAGIYRKTLIVAEKVNYMKTINILSSSDGTRIYFNDGNFAESTEKIEVIEERLNNCLTRSCSRPKELAAD